MGAPKKATHTVVHPKLYMKTGNGSSRHIEAGTEITLSEDQAQKLGNKVLKIGVKKSVDLTAKDDE